jgi:hypothetical protein
MAARSPLDIVNRGGYVPGTCNIGPEEIARRRLSGHLGLVGSVALFAILVAVHAPAATRLLLFITAGISATGYLQAALHFCAGFGSSGITNFGPLGSAVAVVGEENRAKDRRRSLEIGLASALIGIVVAIAAFLLPV